MRIIPVGKQNTAKIFSICIYTRIYTLYRCGHGYGLFILSQSAKSVIGCDPILNFDNPVRHFVPAKSKLNKIGAFQDSIFNYKVKMDVGVAMEVFEHVPSPLLFIKHLSTICDNLFISTPLALTTGKTRNPKHVNEYSSLDFKNIVGEYFDILESIFQLPTLEIVENAKYSGDSIDDNV